MRTGVRPVLRSAPPGRGERLGSDLFRVSISGPQRVFGIPRLWVDNS